MAASFIRGVSDGSREHTIIRHDMESTRKLCAAQGLDKGIVFCTYSLLLQKSVSTKEMAKQQKANPTRFHDSGAASLAEGKAFREAALGTVEFGESPLVHISVRMTQPSCKLLTSGCQHPETLAQQAA